MPALESTRVFDGARLERAGRSGTWAAAALTASDPIFASRMAADDDALVLCNGSAIPLTGSAGGTPAHLLATFRAGGPAAVSASLSGAFNFVGIEPKRGLRAFGDFSGVFPIYWSEGPGYVAVSNRSTTVAEVVGSTGADLDALSWLIAHNNLLGARMPARSVSYVPPARIACVEPGAGIRFERSPDWVWPAPDGEAGQADLGPGGWDRITTALVANFGALRALDEPVKFLLSGGKDSRLCLALAKAANLQDRVRVITNGGPESPEVACARATAEAAGFPHTRRGPSSPVGDPSPESSSRRSESWWSRLRQHQYRYEGIVCPWSGTNERLLGTTLNLRGIGGEVYRRGNEKRARHARPATVEATAAIYLKRMDPLGVLLPEHAEHQAAWVREWFESAAGEVRFDLLPDRWYVDHRLAHWNGPLAQAKPGHINVTPLLSSTAVAECLRLSPEVRGSDRLHFEVIARAAPELLRIPFLNDVWAPEIVAASKIDLPTEPFPTPAKVTAQALRPTQWLHLEQEAEAIERLFDAAAAETDMAAVCDLDALMRLVHEPAVLRRKGAARELYSCIGVALTLLGRGEPVVDDVADGQIPSATPEDAAS
jgi:hypothetical protein